MFGNLFSASVQYSLGLGIATNDVDQLTISNGNHKLYSLELSEV